MGHENKRNPQGIGKTTAAGHCHVTLRQNLPLCRRKAESLFKLDCSLVSNLPEGRPQGNSEPSPMGAASFVDRATKNRFEENVAARCRISRSCHRHMDAEAYFKTDSDKIRHRLYPCRSLEAITPQFWLELPEAGEAGFAAKREGHCRMEKQDLAQYKKKPKNLGPTWHSWTKAGLCSYRLSVKHGLLRAKHQSSDIATAMRRSRQLAVLQSRLEVDDSAFMSVSTLTTSQGMRSLASSDTCCGTCESRWFLYGTEGPFIKERMLKRSWKKTNDSMYSACPVTPPNSTQLNTSGHTVSETCLTAPTKPPTTWEHICGVPSEESEARSDFLSRVSNIRRSHGHEF